jgi:enterochelin esterase family protein
MMEKPKEHLLLRVGNEAGRQRMWARVGAREITIVEGRDLTDAGPHALVLSSGGETALLGYPSKAAVWAFRVDDRGRLSDGAPYCPLRLRRGAPYSEVTGLATDRDGRIYAATEIGVQVFDPTGRLCGVLTPAAKGRPEHMAFEGDHLTMWIDETKYARKLNTMGK